MAGQDTTPANAPFGLLGLGVMGDNLALNLEDHGYRVALWTHTDGKVQRFIDSNGEDRQWVGTRTLEEFVGALARPRRMLLMVKAGKPVDEMLERLMPLLSSGDVVIDGGNSFFRDTQRREAAAREKGFSFVGMGVSGGEEGARYGPSLMPGGTRAAYDLLASGARVHHREDRFRSVRYLRGAGRRRSLREDVLGSRCEVIGIRRTPLSDAEFRGRMREATADAQFVEGADAMTEIRVHFRRTPQSLLGRLRERWQYSRLPATFARLSRAVVLTRVRAAE